MAGVVVGQYIPYRLKAAQPAVGTMPAYVAPYLSSRFRCLPPRLRGRRPSLPSGHFATLTYGCTARHREAFLSTKSNTHALC